MVNVENDAVRLLRAADALGLDLTDNQVQAMLGYVRELSKWNRTYNLTAIRQPDQMLVQHVFDSMAIIPHVRQKLYKKTVERVSILDVGSGAGLPGVILAIANPSWSVECLDAVQKKMAFVRQAGAVLNLPNLVATHARVEQIDPRSASVVVSRAFASLVDFATLAGPHVASDGYLLAMKGVQPDDEIAALHQNTSWRVSEIQTLHVPELSAHRCLVWMHREGNP